MLNDYFVSRERVDSLCGALGELTCNPADNDQIIATGRIPENPEEGAVRDIVEGSLDV